MTAVAQGVLRDGEEVEGSGEEECRFLFGTEADVLDDDLDLPLGTVQSMLKFKRKIKPTKIKNKT